MAVETGSKSVEANKTWMCLRGMGSQKDLGEEMLLGTIILKEGAI
jgi:hypothetical protein